MDRYQLSVCVLTHNRAALLKECLESIVPQVTPATEVVVSDNASQDDTGEVVSAFQLKMGGFRYFRNKTNLGGELNVLRVISEARGEYIFLLGDDDLLTANALAGVRDTLAQHAPGQIGVILSSRRVFDLADGKELPPLEYFNTDKWFESGGQALLGLFLPAHGLSGIVIRRELIDLAGARRYLGSLYPQMYLVGRALKKACGVYLKNPLVTVRINAGNYWEYPADFMAGHIMKMIYELTAGEPPRVRKTLIRKRIRYAVFSLKTAKHRSVKEFFILVANYFRIREYRHSPIFWFYTLGTALLGNKLLNGIKQAVYYFSGNRKLLVKYLYGK